MEVCLAIVIIIDMGLVLTMKAMVFIAVLIVLVPIVMCTVIVTVLSTVTGEWYKQ